MKRITIFLFLLSAMCINVFAQKASDEVNKIKQIKLLESTREDVKKILGGYKADYDAPARLETFSSEKIEIEVSYTTGICSDKSSDADEWNVGDGKVEFIDISFKDAVKFEELSFKASDFRKERLIIDGNESFIYHDKSKGIVLMVEEGKIASIFLIPSTNQTTLLCKNEKSKILREFYSRETYFPVLSSKN
jgi:hypothetical protein